MASSKDTQQSSRPLTYRPSMSSNSASGGLSAHRSSSHSRNSPHSVLSSALNGAHRIGRRKSMTNPSANVAAVAAALEEAGDKATALPIAVSSRRNTMSKNAGARAAAGGSPPSPPASLPAHKFGHLDGLANMEESAIEDDPNDISADEGETKTLQSRVRRASDGQPLAKEGRKSNRPDLRCEKCGKGYKHSSCLNKHLWEHTPQWAYTSKLLISKHQQVQLLEAASVLLTMNNHSTAATTPPDSARDFHSERDSSSPAASGFSDIHDSSSVDTTPPPPLEAIKAQGSYRNVSTRYSNGSGFARSYQSAPCYGSVAGSVPNSSFFGHVPQTSQEQRPVSSGKNYTGQEDRDLAAAVEMLSCSLNSSAGPGTAYLPADAPPVPPLPAQYLDQAAFFGTSFFNSYPKGAPESFTRGEMHREDVKMEGSAESVMDEDDEYDSRSRARSDEDDDGVFGKMEE